VRSGWDSLTATEIKIVGLVEEGLSNPEIAARLLLSRRTVATHVSHILKKLDENSSNVARTAEVLGLERSHLYRKMKALGIAVKESN